MRRHDGKSLRCYTSFPRKRESLTSKYLCLADSKAFNRIVAVQECDATMLNRSYRWWYQKT